MNREISGGILFGNQRERDRAAVALAQLISGFLFAVALFLAALVFLLPGIVINHVRGRYRNEPRSIRASIQDWQTWLIALPISTVALICLSAAGAFSSRPQAADPRPASAPSVATAVPPGELTRRRLPAAMYRLLPASALFVSLCALFLAVWLWRDARARRAEVAAAPLRHRISDEQFARIKDFVDYIHATFDEDQEPRSGVLTADQLLNKARYMHGDIPREEWHRLHGETEGERMRLHVARLQAGGGFVDDILLLQDDVLASSC